jgi:FkbM family methyltransferase
MGKLTRLVPSAVKSRVRATVSRLAGADLLREAQGALAARFAGEIETLRRESDAMRAQLARLEDSLVRLQAESLRRSAALGLVASEALAPESLAGGDGSALPEKLLEWVGFVDTPVGKLLLHPDDTIMSVGLREKKTWEPFETEIVGRELPGATVIVDLGANIGYYSLLFSRTVGEGGRVYAFEPDPTNFAFLQHNLRINAAGNVTPIAKAASATTGPIKLYLSDTNMGDHQVCPSQDRRAVDIQSTTLDDYFASAMPRVDFLKMDIQGAEPLALAGATGLIGASPRLKIITEFWPAGIRALGRDPVEFLEALRSFGFDLFEVNEWEGKFERVGNPRALTDFYTRPCADFTNILCLPRNR